MVDYLTKVGDSQANLAEQVVQTSDGEPSPHLYDSIKVENQKDVIEV